MTARKWPLFGTIGLLLLAFGPLVAANETAPAAAPAADTPACDAAKSDCGSKEECGSQSAADTAKLIACMTVFVLAIFVGFEVITKVPPTLHTPLMSGSNAISGITVIGALILAGAISSPSTAASSTLTQVAKLMAFIAVIFATINVVGGFLVTDRMLRMFKRK